MKRSKRTSKDESSRIGKVLIKTSMRADQVFWKGHASAIDAEDQGGHARDARWSGKLVTKLMQVDMC